MRAMRVGSIVKDSGGRYWRVWYMQYAPSWGIRVGLERTHHVRLSYLSRLFREGCVVVRP